jgi:alanine-glyoxylate transaminase/serine-glyoxylate transaminase/serine-pyruvate transaminase
MIRDPGTEQPLNMSTGPVEVSRAVRAVVVDSFLSPHRQSFWDLHDETLALVGDFLESRGRVLAFHGSIRAGLDVTLANFVRPGARVLALENGYWGQLIGKWAAHYGAEIVFLSEDVRRPLDPMRVAACLDDDGPFDLVTAVHVETNTGILNPIEAIGPVVSRTGALYLVDTACSAGGIPISTDAWGIDISVTGSHKCLCAVPGLAIVTLSERAWDRLAAGGSTAGNYYAFREWHAQTIERQNTPPFTQPTTLFYALHEALKELSGIGKERWFALHREAAALFRRRMGELNLRMLLGEAWCSNASIYSDTVMAVEYPQGVSDTDFREMLNNDFGVFVIGNVGVFAGQSFRVGLMSPPQLSPRNLLGTIAAIGETIGYLAKQQPQDRHRSKENVNVEEPR